MKYLSRRFNKAILYPGNKGKIDETLSFLLGIKIYDARPPIPRKTTKEFSRFFPLPPYFLFPLFSSPFLSFLFSRFFSSNPSSSAAAVSVSFEDRSEPTDRPPIPKFGKKKKGTKMTFCAFSTRLYFSPRDPFFSLFSFFGRMVKVRNRQLAFPAGNCTRKKKTLVKRPMVFRPKNFYAKIRCRRLAGWFSRCSSFPQSIWPIKSNAAVATTTTAAAAKAKAR